MGGDHRPRFSPQSQSKGNTAPPSREAGLFPLASAGFQTEDARQLKSKDKCKLARLMEEATWGLNWMHGELSRAPLRRTGHPARESKIRILHGQVQRRIEELGLRALDSTRALNQKEAMQSLLKGRSPYTFSSSTAVVPVDVSKVALAENLDSAPYLDELLPSQDSKLITGDLAGILRPLPQVAAINEVFGIATSYMDEKLKRSKRLYAKFINMCRSRGMIKLSLKARSVQGVFFVRKKDGRQRMIIDCRPCNRLFLDPPGTQLLTGEGLSEIEIVDEEFVKSGLGVHFACGDVDACFHRLKLRGDICEYFGWEPIEAKWLGNIVINGQPVAASQLIYPLSTSLPMGFSWATYLAQTVTSRLFTKAISPLNSHHLTDASFSKVLCTQPDSAIDYTYIDNLGIISASKSNVVGAIDRAQQVFNGVNLTLHEIDVHSSVAVPLGVMLDLVHFTTSNSPERYGRIHQAIGYVLNQRMLSGWVLEVLIGHCTYFGLVNRDMLCVFHAAYNFIAKHYSKRAPPFGTVCARSSGHTGEL